jgi:hypothetical protein
MALNRGALLRFVFGLHFSPACLQRTGKNSACHREAARSVPVAAGKTVGLPGGRRFSEAEAPPAEMLEPLLTFRLSRALYLWPDIFTCHHYIIEPD